MIRKIVLFVAAAWTACAAPCITASSNCTEWIPLGTGGARALIYRSYPIESEREQITRALIIVHGAGRNADDYFRTGIAAAFLAGALDNTMIIAPRFASKDRGCNDALAVNEISWLRCGGGPKLIDLEKITFCQTLWCANSIRLSEESE